jgi:Flp pilus assembly protein TadG
MDTTAGIILSASSASLAVLVSRRRSRRRLAARRVRGLFDGPGTFRVTGTDRRDGGARALVFRAPGAAVARRKADAVGVDVAAVERVAADPPSARERVGRRGPCAARGHCGGAVLIYVMVAMPLFVLCCAIGVDWGRVQLAKTELGSTADATARYAVTGLGDNSSLAKANYLAQLNSVDGSPVTFAAADVEVGTWDAASASFAPGGGAPNAVRVTARRTVPLPFGQFAGTPGVTITARAVARFNVIGYGLVGLNSLTMSGNSSASYASAGGASVGSQGNVASNGNITLGNSTTIRGNTYAGVGMATTGGSVTGTRGTLTGVLSFPNGDPGAYGPNNNDDTNIPSWASPGGANFALQNSQSVTLPGGNYYVGNVSMSGGSSVTFTGPATIYCYGTFTMSGNTQTSGNVAGNLKLVMVPKPWDGSPPGSVTIGSSAAFYGTIYAPQSDVSIGGTGDVYGSVLGRTVNMSGTGSVIYDLSLNSQNGTLSLVQ